MSGRIVGSGRCLLLCHTKKKVQIMIEPAYQRVYMAPIEHC